MWNEPTEQDLELIPQMYSTGHLPIKDAMVHMHFFLGGCDWYVTEYDPGERRFFGYAILNGDLDNAEWGYISFDELRGLRVNPGLEVDRDCYWKPKKASEVENIAQGEGWIE